MKYKAKVEIDGKEIEMDIEISKEELEKLKPKVKDTGYGYGHLNDLHYKITGDGYVSLIQDITMMEVYNTACNLYHDKTLAEKHARADKLMRQLRKFAAEHNKKELDWSRQPLTNKYEIRCDYTRSTNSRLYIDYWYETRSFGGIFFDSKETAQLAIDTFRDELLWYFIEYRG